MLKRIAQGGLGVVLAGGALIGWFVWRGETVVSLGQTELQQAIALGFPVEKTYLAVVHTRLSDPVVELKEGSDRIGLTVAVEIGLQGVGKPTRGSASLSCRIRYEPAEGSFYADDPSVDRLSLDGHPEGATGAITWIVKGLLAHHPIYTLPSSGFGRSAAKLVLKDVRVQNGALRLTLSVDREALKGLGP
jgi:hypothetical protein